MTAYMHVFYKFNDSRLPWVPIIIRDNPLADGDLLCEWETENSHDPQGMWGYQEVINGIPAASCWACA